MQQLTIEAQTVHFSSSARMQELPDKSVDFIVTSPPYWNLKDYGGPEGSIGLASYEDYLAQLNAVWTQCYAKAKDSAVMVINVNTRRHKKRFYPIPFDIAAHMEGWTLWDVNIWYIPNALPQPNSYRERLLDNKLEYLLVFTKDGRSDYKFHKPRVPQKYRTADPRAHKKNARGRCLGNIIRVPAYRPPNVKSLGYHVAAYPEELVAFLLESYTDEGDTVLDPFVGSGTTLKVANVMNRRGVGYEINPDFRPLIEARIKEPWELPDWRSLDIIHSTTMVPGMQGTRKIHFLRGNGDESESSDATKQDQDDSRQTSLF